MLSTRPETAHRVSHEVLHSRLALADVGGGTGGGGGGRHAGNWRPNRNSGWVPLSGRPTVRSGDAASITHEPQAVSWQDVGPPETVPPRVAQVARNLGRQEAF